MWGCSNGVPGPTAARPTAGAAAAAGSRGGAPAPAAACPAPGGRTAGCTARSTPIAMSYLIMVSVPRKVAQALQRVFCAFHLACEDTHARTHTQFNTQTHMHACMHAQEHAHAHHKPAPLPSPARRVPTLGYTLIYHPHTLSHTHTCNILCPLPSPARRASSAAPHPRQARAASGRPRTPASHTSIML